MNPALGPFLRELRRQRGLAVTDAAATARLGRRALSRWETGQTLPRLAELESLLCALQATPEARRQAHELLQAPRALRRARESAAEPGDALPSPRGGDLLRSLRHRQGWTQAQVAASVDVAQSTVMRWERSEAWPSLTVLQRLCDVLGAAEEEFAALASGRFSLAGWDGRKTIDLDELREELKLLSSKPADVRSSPLGDLRYLTLEARLETLRRREPEAASPLADTYLAHSRNLFVQCRVLEMRECAMRVKTLSVPDDLERRMRAAIYLAEAAAFGKTYFGYEQAARLLKPWANVPASANNRAWISAVLGWMIAPLGDREGAATLARRGVRALGLVEDPVTRLHRQLPLGGILVECGQPEEALPLLQTTPRDAPPDRAYGCFYLAKACLALGRRSEAADALALAREGIVAHKLHFMRDALEPLENEV